MIENAMVVGLDAHYARQDRLADEDSAVYAEIVSEFRAAIVTGGDVNWCVYHAPSSCGYKLGVTSINEAILECIDYEEVRPLLMALIKSPSAKASEALQDAMAERWARLHADATAEYRRAFA